MKQNVFNTLSKKIFQIKQTKVITYSRCNVRFLENQNKR